MGIPARTRVTLTDDNDGGGRREFHLSRPWLFLVAAAIVLTWVGIGLLVAGVLTNRDLRATNAVLEDQLADARAEVLAGRALKAELEASRRMQVDLLRMLGVAKADSAATDTTRVARVVASPLHDASEAGPPPSRWPAAGTIIREFTRGDPVRGVEPNLGVDIAGTEGARVVAAAAGEVEHIGTDDVLGTTVEIRHGYDYLTIYGHCGPVTVALGQTVGVGEQVAKMGRTGQTAIPQLHFEVWQKGEAVDPRKVLAGEPAPR